MMHGHRSGPRHSAMKPANKAKEAHCGGVCGGEAAESVERRRGKGKNATSTTRTGPRARLA